MLNGDPSKMSNWLYINSAKFDNWETVMVIIYHIEKEKGFKYVISQSGYVALFESTMREEPYVMVGLSQFDENKNHLGYYNNLEATKKLITDFVTLYFKDNDISLYP